MKSRGSDIDRRKRIIWIDQLRAVAFFFVIFGHANFLLLPENAFFEKRFLIALIYSFHMPLFFILSGITFNNDKVLKIKDLLSQILKYVKRLLIPYFWMNFALFPLWIFVYKVIGNNGLELKDIFVGIFISNTNLKPMVGGALWFLTDLFLTVVLFAVLTFLTHSNRLLMLPVIILFGAMGYLTRSVDLPWHINTVCTSLVFVYIGNVFMYGYRSGKFKKLLKTDFISILLLLLCFVIWFTACYFNGEVDMMDNNYGTKLDNIALFYIGALSGSWWIFYLVNKLPHIKLFTYLGRNTMLYMGIHLYPLRFLEFSCRDLMKNVFFILLICVVIYLAMVPCSVLCNRFIPYIAGAKSDISEYKRYERVLYKLGKYLSVFMSVLVPFYIFFRHFFGFESTLSVIVYILVTALLTAVITLFTNKFLPFIYLEEYKGMRKSENSI